MQIAAVGLELGLQLLGAFQIRAQIRRLLSIVIIEKRRPGVLRTARPPGLAGM